MSNFLGIDISKTRLCAAATNKVMFVRSFIEDEGRSFEIGFQEQVSNHLKWLYLRDKGHKR